MRLYQIWVIRKVRSIRVQRNEYEDKVAESVMMDILDIEHEIVEVIEHEISEEIRGEDCIPPVVRYLYNRRKELYLYLSKRLSELIDEKDIKIIGERVDGIDARIDGMTEALWHLQKAVAGMLGEEEEK